MQTAQETAELLQRYAGKRILLTAHTNPDGDALGSVAALGHIATVLGCDVRIFLATGIPAQLAWVPLHWPVVRTAAELGTWSPDLLVIADCGDAHRPGPELAAFLTHAALPSPAWQTTQTLCIDHHLNDAPFALHNWVDPTMAATGQMVGILAEKLGIPLAGELGKAVYLCLVADTGNFSFSNTTADPLAMAARIAAAGLRVAEFTQQYENNWTLSRMHLWGRLMSEVTLHAGGAVARSVVTQATVASFQCKKGDIDGFAAYLRRIQGVQVALFVREDGDACSKISLRSMGDVNVRSVAAHFGGGGHAAASGAEIALPAEEAASAVLRHLLMEMGKQE